MSQKKSVLERVTVSFRCPMNWEAMAGGGQDRFCGKCQKSVVDLSMLTEEEAGEYVLTHGSQGSACVRLLRDENGVLVTKGCGSAQENGKAALRKTAVAAAAAGGLALASCAKQQPVEVLGMICLPAEK